MEVVPPQQQRPLLHPVEVKGQDGLAPSAHLCHYSGLEEQVLVVRARGVLNHIAALIFKITLLLQ